MSRRMLRLLAGFALVVLPGCFHQDQDLVVQTAALELAQLPRDAHTQTILNTPRPKQEFQETPIGKGQFDTLKLPPNLPGIHASPIVLPPIDPKKLQDPGRDKAIQALYPALPPLEDELKPAPGPNGQPLDLPALQQLAMAGNPIIQQAAADVQAAGGGAIQAGLYPNPSFGMQWDSIGQAGTIGQPGAYFEQTIKTAGKLELARCAGLADVRSAYLALRRTQLDVMTQVRHGYFAVLVAQENVAITRSLALIAEEVHRLQIKLVQAGQAAAYEPLQLHVFAVQARGNLTQARNRYSSAWRQLAAALGQPELQPMQLAGSPEAVVPGYEYDSLRAHMLTGHTDMGTANNGMLKSRILLQLAKVASVPDINTHVYVQKDHTAEPNKFQAGVQIGMEIPVYHLNQGTIMQANAQLAKSNRELARVENDLTQRLADAFERYRNNITLAAYYRDSILPNQIRVYRATHERYERQPGQVNYNDVAVAQQSVALGMQTYIQTLMAQWQAVVDLAALAQTDDIYQLTFPSSTPCACPTPVSQLLDMRSWSGGSSASLRIADSPTQPQGSAPRAVLARPMVLPAPGELR